MAGALGLGADDNPKLTSALGQLMMLPEIVVKQIQQVDGIDHEMYLEWQPAVDQFFGTINLNAGWQSSRGILTEVALTKLNFCADVLSRTHREQDVSLELLDGFRNDAESLRDEILSSEVDPLVKAFLAEHLEAVIEAIELYAITGEKAIKQAVHTAFGASLLEKGVEEAAKGTVVWNKAKKLFTGIAIALTITNGTFQLGENVSNLLDGEALLEKPQSGEEGKGGPKPNEADSVVV